MISFLRRLLTRQPSELEQMRRNRDYWREEALRLQVDVDGLRADLADERAQAEVGRHKLKEELADARVQIGFLRSCIRSGESLSPADDAAIDAVLARSAP